ncbi:MAG: amidophosphoribosyltransferase [Opitutales bacterium]
MSDPIKHECGIALVRLRQPLAYYQQKYGTPLYGFNKLFLLMEKQHNRGQDGAGIGCVKLGVPPGRAYMFRDRDDRRNPIDRVIKRQLKDYDELVRKNVIVPEFPDTVKEHFAFGGEVLMGHLRYATSGGYGRSVCQPYYRKSAWPTRALMLGGNFNMTNVDDLNRRLISRGAHPIFDTDTQTVLEEIGYHLDEEHQRIYHELRDVGTPRESIAKIISERLDPADILSKAGQHWDGGYTLTGLIGNGDCFVMRDPLGIRPAYYFADAEVVAIASERVALMTIFNQPKEAVWEIPPGCAVVVKNDGSVAEKRFRAAGERKSCTFERIYFSRGNDPDIYQERKALGAALAERIEVAVDHDHARAVFSYVPNTAETAYYGLIEELHRRHRITVREQLLALAAEGRLDAVAIDRLLSGGWPRGEKIAHKDIKLRTFISEEASRTQMASHVYDITYGQVGPDDSLVCVDDSIVRGTTLKQSILRILAYTKPRRIVIASTAPQIRYPDCYGIDMSEMGKFIAFQAAVELLKETGKSHVLREVYADCVAQRDNPSGELVNHVRRIYDPFTEEQVSARIAELVYPRDNGWHGEVLVIYQRVEDLQAALPKHTGTWYFTGDYPTPGGYKVLNQAYINYYEKRAGRAY